MTSPKVGVMPESLAEKFFKRALKKIPVEQQSSFSKASHEEQLTIYHEMLAKAKQTNPNLNSALTAPPMARPLDLPDDQPNPAPAAPTPSGPRG
jgi:hypothetical protein